MAKKQNASRADAVREAVDQAFKTQIPRERISELLDELGNTAGRLRGAVDDLRPASDADVKALRSQLASLTARVAALETQQPKAKPAPRRRAPAATTAAPKTKAAASKPRSGAKSSASKPSAAKPSAAKPSAAKKRAGRSASKSAGP